MAWMRTAIFGNIGLHVMVHPVKAHIHVNGLQASASLDSNHSSGRGYRGPGIHA
jgi:hypothetical protein